LPDSGNHTDLKKSVWIIILLILGTAGYGQQRDARLWAGLSVRYEPAKKWKLSLEEELRFYENVSRLEKSNTELDVNYQITKLVDGGLLFRLISSPDSRGSFDFNFRFSGYLGIQKKIAGWTGSLKSSYQKTYPEFQHSDAWYLPENYIRVLAEVSRGLKNKKTEPYTNIELWYRLRAAEPDFIDQYRFTVGIKHKLNKTNRLDFFYRLQHEMQVKNPLTAHIVGVGYRYTIR